MRKLVLPAALVSIMVYGCLSAMGQNKFQSDSPPYTTTKLFQYFLATHKSPKWVSPELLPEEGNQLLHLTWFLNGEPHLGMQQIVDSKGRAYKVRSIPSYAEQASSTWYLSAQDLDALRTALRGIHSNHAPPSLKELVVLSFSQQGKWKTRLYSKAELPPSVQKLLKGSSAYVTKPSLTDKR